MSDKFASTISAYNQYAPQFAQHLEKRLDTNELTRFLSLIPKGGSVLDAGCGTARDAAYIISKGYQALGIDLSEGLLAEASKIHPEVPTKVMSLTDITLPDASFDGVWCKAALLHLDRNEVPSVLESFNRILKKDGYLFVQTKAGEGEKAEPAPFDPKVTRYFTYFSLAELTDLVRQADFEIIEGYDFNGKQRNDTSRDINWVVIFAKKNS